MFELVSQWLSTMPRSLIWFNNSINSVSLPQITNE